MRSLTIIYAWTLIWMFSIPKQAHCQGELLVKDFSYLYDPRGEIQLRHRVVNLEGRSLLYLKMVIRHNRTKIQDLITTYASLDKYPGSLVFSKDTINLSDFWINNIGNEHFFNFEVANPDKKKILILKILNRRTENEFYFDIPIDPNARTLNTGIILKLPDQNLPFFRSHVRMSEEFTIDNVKNPDPAHYVYRYTNDFPAAAPPFSSNDDNVTKELKIDSMFTLNTGQRISLNKVGLYFVQKDTTGVNGLAFRNETAFYPRETTFEQLIESLVYFSTKSEMNRLLSASNRKKAFDEYWLDVANTPDRAKKVLADYYKRVRQANDLFTNYKEGWKTDKGMIYIVFGPPDVVNKDGKREEWIYERSAQLPRMSYEFQKIESIFTHDHFVLVRKRSYQQVWYKAIDLWRKGQMD